jgi:hypothetical protein
VSDNVGETLVEDPDMWIKHLEDEVSHLRNLLEGEGPSAGIRGDVAVIAAGFKTFLEDHAEFRRKTEQRLQAHDEEFKAVWQRMDGRPSWTVTIVLSVMSSVIVGLITFISTVPQH